VNREVASSTRAVGWGDPSLPRFTSAGQDGANGVAIQSESAEGDFGWISGVFAAHLVLGFAMFYFRQLAGVHALIVFGVGIWAATRKPPVVVACVAAYIAGSEVLWRLMQAPVPYEIGKYSIVTLFGISLLRMGRRAKWQSLALVYFLLLLPSILVPLGDSQLGLDNIRMRVSFNLSGPLALSMSVLFLSQVTLTPSNFRRILVAYIGPSIALAVATLIATYTAKDLVFTGESNTITSGGFGPNQVSATLGIAAMFALLLAIDKKSTMWNKIVAAGSVLLLATQSAMTFSRGGLYVAALALLLGAPFLLSDRRMRRAFFGVCAVSGVAMAVAIIPRLQQFTGGALETRFSDSNPTNRGELIRDDLRIWFDHPILGVGPGGVKGHRDEVGGSGHTEYSRLLAEHGVFGFAALMTLCVMALQVLVKREDRVSHGLRITLLVASGLSMSTAAMRIALFALMFGLAHAHFSSPSRLSGSLKS